MPLPLAQVGITTQSAVVPTAAQITTVTSAYPTVAVIGGKLTFPSALRSPMQTGMLNDIRLAIKSVQTAPLEVWLFAAPPASTFADNASPVTGGNTADLAILVDRCPLAVDASNLFTAMTLYRLSGNPRVVWSQSTNLYGILVCTAAITFTTATDIAQLSLGILQD